ncbi:MFS transporter [Bordetella genomosp. 13]|uniref:MFS transporter n=1 Tax=Bordetella genomosp. 13 TaxID=463040 RepID=UPI00119DF4E6|nr:MFS transporter [Bordetella genomosp. 13]
MSTNAMQATVAIDRDRAAHGGDGGPAAAPRAVGKKELNKVVLASVVGSFVEWFEFSVYGYLASVLGRVFFPSTEPGMQLIASLAAFAVAFFARPFGGVIFGPIGDRFGRKRVLTVTILMMAVSTFAIGLIPSYATIGVAAPILLVLLRLLQGISAGGEGSGAAIFVAEYCSDKRRTAITSWIEVGCISGFAFGATITTVLTAIFSVEQITEWAWRIPFLLALPLGAIGLYIRDKLEETPAFEAVRASKKAHPQATWSELFSTHRAELLQSCGFIIVTNITLYTVTTYIPTYLSSALAMKESAGFLLSLGPQLFLIAMIPVMGIIADRISRKRLMLAGSVGVLVLAIPCFHLLAEGSYVIKVVSLLLLNLCLAALLGCIFAAVPALFHTRVRFTGMAFSYNVAVALFAGTAPMLNAWLIQRTGNTTMPAYYLMFGAVVGIVALLYSRDRTGQPMPGDAARAQ